MSHQPEPLHRMDDVDRAADPRQYINYLDQASASESMRLLKQRSFALMGARAGSHLLDAGCGVGDDVRALAQLAGPAGRVVGVDSSEAMIAEARRRSDGSQLPVEFYARSIYHLDFADHTFDAARAERVFMHLSEPAAALAELWRVVKPGGYLVVVDPDWETLVVDSSDRRVTRKIWQVAVDGVVNGWIGRQLVGLFKQQGLTEIGVEPVNLTSTNLEGANRAWGFRMHAARAVSDGVVSADEAEHWLSDLEARDRSGRFFGALSGFMVRGRKV